MMAEMVAIITNYRAERAVIATALKRAYSEGGYNTLALVWNNSYHASAIHVYARRAVTGRRVKNPVAWLDGAMRYTAPEDRRKISAMYADEGRSV